jgi:hypothetical protein
MPFILEVSGGVNILLMRHLGNLFLSQQMFSFNTKEFFNM